MTNISTRSRNIFSIAILTASSIAGLVSCGGTENPTSTTAPATIQLEPSAEALAPSESESPKVADPAVITETPPDPVSTVLGTPVFADFDESTDPEQLTVALKYVTYLSDEGVPVIGPEESKSSVQFLNQVMSPCRLRFIIQDYVQEPTAQSGLPFEIDSLTQLPSIRSRYQENDRLVVTFTGPWNHSSVGAGNAWTTLPGANPPGAVLESRVSGDPEILAHELGHYLGLDHVSDPSNLMNPVVHKTSTDLTPSQCETLRSVAENEWKAAKR